MKQEIIEAKKMYFYYCGNHIYMMNNGDFEKYSGFRITNRQENRWRRELIAQEVSKLDPNDLTALHNLKTLGAIEVITKILRYSDKGDGYAKLWYGEAIWQIADNPFHPLLRIKLFKMARNLWQSLIESPFEITEEHRKEITSALIILGLKSPEEYIITFAQRYLKERKWTLL
jgi:hypothetical protein